MYQRLSTPKSARAVTKRPRDPLPSSNPDYTDPEATPTNPRQVAADAQHVKYLQDAQFPATASDVSNDTAETRSSKRSRQSSPKKSDFWYTVDEIEFLSFAEADPHRFPPRLLVMKDDIEKIADSIGVLSIDTKV